jgi:hypothetical protein
MAEIVLSQVGQVAGAQLLPQGLSVFGQQIAGAAIGKAVGGFIGRAIDASLVPATEGPRVKMLHVMESREGAGLPTVYGRMRVGGQVIWASRFKEKRRERSVGKGGPKYADYSYSVSFAVALCQGPVTRVDRIWANGELVTLADVNWRLYQGGEDQAPDPLIEAIEGAGAAPAYRGTAYIVFEDLSLDAYGNRMPQLSFEVVRAGEAQAGGLRELVQGVNVIPASGEFVYGTDIVRERRFPGIETVLNMNNGDGRSDFALSVEQLQADLPRVGAAALTVAWFGDDVDAGNCRIRPGVETRTRETVPYGWTVDGTGRGSAHLISRDAGGDASYGGTPADRAVLEGIAALYAAGVAVTMSPFLLMDSAGFPWRGRIGVSADGTAVARAEVEAFVGVDGGFGFRHFILHHARLAAQAAEQGTPVEAFLLGSEFVGMTRVRDAAGAFPFVEALVALAGEVRTIVGPAVKISYAADWTEYGAYVPQDGSGDVLFPLDALWASADVDFVGVDWYAPAGDWRDSEHLDALAGFRAADDTDYLRAQMDGGEGYDWYYASEADRAGQVRTLIVDTAHGEDWVFRHKDLAGWWGHAHFARPNGVQDAEATDWVAGSKPVRLIEIGFPAVDRGGNSPNLFYDPKSDESALPPFSSGARDDLYQRRALTAALSYWQGQSFVEQALVWAWDGRPWPHYPSREAVWTDGSNWQFGHWLNGRMGLIELSEVIDDLARRAGIAVDVSGVVGFVEGFAIEGVTNLRGALAALEAAFGLSCVERGGVLHFAMRGGGAVAVLDDVDFVEDSVGWTRTLLDKLPGGLMLTYVSGDGDYQPAIAEARFEGGDRDYVVRLNMPLVMGEGRARDLAQQLLAQAVAARSGALALGPEGLAIEAGDRVEIAGACWQVAGVRDDGLQRGLSLLPDVGGLAEFRAGDVAGAADAAVIGAVPEFVVIDGPRVPGFGNAGPLVAVAAEPWTGSVTVSAGPDAASMTVRAQVDAPCGMGLLVADLAIGPLGRWDEAAVLEIEMVDADFASLSRLAVLNGGGMLLVQGDEGWELLAYRYAELVGADRWRLSGLLRGLAGSVIGAHRVGAIVVVADARLVVADMDAGEVGLDLVWQVTRGAAQTQRYEDRSGLPWRVGHLRADGRRVSWTRRGGDIAESWALPEVENQGAFRVECLAAGVVITAAEQVAAFVDAPLGCDLVRVAQVGTDGRVGPWASIPLDGA